MKATKDKINNTHLLTETIEDLTNVGLDITDIKFISLGNNVITTDINELFDVWYDSGYGGAEVPNFKVVGKGWWLERGEYDGSEWWEFKKLPKKPKHVIPFNIILDSE